MLPCLLVLLLAEAQVRPSDGRPVTQLPADNLSQCLYPHCYHKSKCHINGEKISSEYYDWSSWCHGLLCINGNTVGWDNFNCNPTTDSPPSDVAKLQTSSNPITTSTAIEPPACFHDGNWYPLGAEISRESDGNGWCYGMYCGVDGQLMRWDDLNCGTTAQPSSTTHTPRPTRHGCFDNGKWYPPESDISKGSDGEGWCYGIFCTADGGFIAWDDWNCDPAATKPSSPTTSPASTTTATPAPTTTPAPVTTTEPLPTTTPAPVTTTDLLPTTTPASTTNSVLNPTTVPIPLGCFQNGAWYEPGSEISRESDEQGLCHGISCDHNGKIVAWDDWNCAMQGESMVTKSQPKGCYYDNQWYPYGSIFEGSDSTGCKYGAMCGMDGQVTRWDEIDCSSAS